MRETGAGAFDAFGGDLLFPLSAEDDTAARCGPTSRGLRNLGRRNQVRAARDPDADMAATIRVEVRAVALDGAGREDAPLRDVERSPFRLRVLGPDERRHELSVQVLGDIDRELDGLAAFFAAARSDCFASASGADKAMTATVAAQATTARRAR